MIIRMRMKTMAKNLILYGQSGFNCNMAKKLETIAVNLDDCIVALMEDASLGTVKSLTDNIGESRYAKIQDQKVNLVVLQEDLVARGYTSDNLIDGIKPVSYLDLVDLIESADRVISWI
jgi:sulfur relay protein TusB/DsrH